MSDGSNSDDDIDKLLNDFESSPSKSSKPLLEGRPRHPMSRQRSHSLEEDENEVGTPPPAPVTEETKRPFALPVSNRPKPNPNANLLGGSLFANEGGASQTRRNPPSKLHQTNRPETAPGVTAKGPEFPTKAPKGSGGGAKKPLNDWLGIGGGESVLLSPAVTPIAQRKQYEETGGDSGDPFSFNPRSGPQFHDPLIYNSKELKPDFLVPAPKKSIPIQKQQPPVSKSASDFVDSESGLPPFLEKLMSKGMATPDLHKNVPIERPPSASTEVTGGGDVGQKKRIVTTVRKVVPSSSAATLQVPSHVIDEDELKRMSSSLKQLYENQVEMLEKSYKEQMDCLVQSYARKEDMLRAEIKMMRKDYEERLSRLKGELAESETKPLMNRTQNQEYITLASTLSDQLKHLQAQIEILTNQRRDVINPATDDINHILDVKLSTFLNAFESNFGNLNQNSKNQSGDENLKKKLDGIVLQLASQSKLHQDSVSDLKSFTEMNTKVESGINKISKEQKKLRETMLKTTVTHMTQSLESKHEEHRKKDKITNVIREFRRDVQRFMGDIECKQDSVQKSQVSIEGEQKHLAQSFHDLSTWLQVNLTNHQQQQQCPMGQSSVQNEFELKLLKEERNVLSETIAQMNVDKRRIHGEKIQLETEKRDFERQRMQLHDLETTLRIKLSDAEDSRKQTETLRMEHMKLAAELSKKMNEVEKERLRYHDLTRTIDLQTGLQKQRQDEERAEIIREREFVEKLRLQFLCPGCLRLLRSQGDGIDTQAQGQVAKPIYHQHRTQVQPVIIDMEREGRQLKEMITNYYGNAERYN